MKPKERLIELAFGTLADSAESAARKSKRTFVRGLGQLAEDHPSATGRRLTALEALQSYGIETLAEVGAEGFARLAPSAEVAGRFLKLRREQLGLDYRDVALRAGVDQKVVRAAEESRRLPLRTYERIARSLGLDERYVTVRAEPIGNERIAVRLRTIGEADEHLSPRTVSALAEAAWVAMTQVRLEEEFGFGPRPTGIEPSRDYGSPGFPAYECGYQLARDARERLKLGIKPIMSVRTLADQTLGLPLIQAELDESIAGVTMEVTSSKSSLRRAIVINLAGSNRSVFVRRATIAHELGHLLYDPPASLSDLRVDSYADLEAPVEQLPDYVEQRANAFAVEFLAPQEEAMKLYQSTAQDPLGEVMRQFGISFTAARYQIWNGMQRKIPIEEIATRWHEFPADWEGREAYTADYHPLRGIQRTRAGRFSAVAVRAAEEGLISWDTAAEWLTSTDAEVRQCAGDLHELFPEVWNAAGKRR